MKCERCGYLLFNLPGPQCPECGLMFDVSRYRFEPGSIAFQCPRCRQEYFGNDANGLPSPANFMCVQCAAPVSLYQMPVVPKRPDAMGRLGVPSPWDQRLKLGFWQAWWQTLMMLLFKPSTFYRNHDGTSYVEAFWFSMVSLYVGFIPYCAFTTLLLFFMSKIMASTTSPPPVIFISFQIAMNVAVALFGPLLYPWVYGAFAVVFIHPALCVLASKRKSIGHTFRLAMYSLAPQSSLLVPICGAYAAGIWALVVLIIGVKEVHETTGGRAVLAVLWPAALGFIAAVVVLFLII
ncbi:MAG: Yip1 family protein [Planctomycetota bacterium]